MSDVVVVGAGVVGLACAAELAERGQDVLVLERHERFGVETSSRNSEVIHAGIYYTPGSAKARFCVEGNRRLYQFCQQYDVPHRRTGKLIVAVNPEDAVELEALHARAITNGVAGMRWMEPPDVARLEPAVRCSRALFSETSGIVDSHGLMAALQGLGESRGAQYAYRVSVTGVDYSGSGPYRLTVEDSDGQPFQLEAAAVVNAAGLDADRLAAMLGFDVDALGYRQHYWAGHYYRLGSRHRNRVRHLVYPVPEKNLVGLGVHVTLNLAGDMRLGPDAEYRAERTQDYGFRPNVASSTGEGSRADAFYRAASRYLSDFDVSDMVEDQVGLRPKLQKPGDPIRDFVIADESARGFPGWVNLVGIESPGLTCALVIAETVAGTLATTSVV